MAQTKNASAKFTGPIAYLSGEYPKVSHTFILREIAALRANGIQILTCSVRRANAEDVVGDDQHAEAATTFGILETIKKAPYRLIWAHAKAFGRAPLRWFSALWLAWQTRPPGMKALLWQIFYFAEAGVLADHLHRNGIVHLHNHFANSSCSVAMLTSVMSGIPFSFTLHGPAIFFEPKWWRIDEKIARARFVACISHFSRSQAMLFSDQVHWSKLHIVHCGVQPSAYGQEKREAFAKRVLYVGRLDAIKGVPLLLDAFAAALKIYPDAKLTIVGDGRDRAALERQAKDLGNSVTFLGYQPQEAVAKLLQKSDMLVLPSFAEGVPVVLMEAMASRIPVIASRVAGVSELVEDGISGFLVPPGDLETLTVKLIALLADPTLCARMGEVGRAKVEVAYNLNQEAARIGKLFAE